MRGLFRSLFFLVLAGAACNAVSGVGDLEVDPCAGEACADAGDGSVIGEGGANEGSTTIDGGVDGAQKPSFCEGLSLYLPFDGTPNAQQGDVPAQVNGTLSYTPGKVGLAVAMVGQASIFYTAMPDGGPVRYPEERGTVSLWFRPNWTFPPTVPRTFARPKEAFAGSGAGGPQIEIGPAAPPAQMGIDVSGQAGAVRPLEELAALWANVDWNHLVGTWSQTSTPTLAFALNGATSDAGYVDTPDAWSPPQPVVYFRLGGTTNPMDGVLDEVAVWTRVLPLLEIRAVYQAGVAGQSLGALCGL